MKKTMQKSIGILKPEHAEAIKKIEDVHTVMMRVSQQQHLATEDILRKHFGLQEKDLKFLTAELERYMTALVYVEENGLSAFSPSAMEAVGKLVDNKKSQLYVEDMEKSGLVLPNSIHDPKKEKN